MFDATAPVPQSNVVTFREGETIANPAAPDQSVIAELERLLALAQSGQIVGIASAIQYYDGVGQNHFEGRVSRNTVGQLFAVATRISLRIDQEP